MLYKIVRISSKIYYSIFFRLKVHGIDNIPKDGAAIICSNHLSNYDPITLAVVLERLPSFLAKSQLFSNKLFGDFLLKLDAIPVNREKVEMNSFRTVMNRLKDGHLIVVFAQGHRVKEGEANEAKAGVALFAVKSGASVIPTAIVTNYKLFKKIDIVFGEQVDFSEYKGKKVDSEKLNEISTNLMARVDALIAEYK